MVDGRIRDLYQYTKQISLRTTHHRTDPFICSIWSKVMEGLTVEILSKHLEETNRLSDEQYRFQKDQSMIDVVRKVVGIAREAKMRG